MFSEDVVRQAAALLDACAAAGIKLATAESCTGGLIAAVLTEVPGSSRAVDRGFVTYSNEAKTALLDVPADLIAQHGAVSEPVVRAMAEGALAHSDADLVVAVTGVAGPGGGARDKPVGTVHLTTARRGAPPHHCAERFDGDRRAVREATVVRALEMLADQVTGAGRREA